MKVDFHICNAILVKIGFMTSRKHMEVGTCVSTPEADPGSNNSIGCFHISWWSG